MARLAGISIDVDPAHTHLQGYGISLGSSAARPVYQYGLPRAIALFAEAKVSATFFFVAEDIARFPEILREVANAGHEIGCHSATHELPFDLSNPSRRQREIADARKKLEDLSGSEVVGFRAPSWDSSDDLLNGLLDAGFKYDSSAYPSWAAWALRLLVRLKASGTSPNVHLPSLESLFANAEPYLVEKNQGNLAEIPVSSSRWLRLPYYHTMRFLLPSAVFNAVESSTLARSGAINYILHGVDFIELHDPNVPQELARHPGMSIGIDDKLAGINSTLRRICAARNAVPLKIIAQAVIDARK